jgi:hypothetical protein
MGPKCCTETDIQETCITFTANRLVLCGIRIILSSLKSFSLQKNSGLETYFLSLDFFWP